MIQIFYDYYCIIIIIIEIKLILNKWSEMRWNWSDLHWVWIIWDWNQSKGRNLFFSCLLQQQVSLIVILALRPWIRFSENLTWVNTIAESESSSNRFPFNTHLPPGTDQFSISFFLRTFCCGLWIFHQSKALTCAYIEYCYATLFSPYNIISVASINKLYANAPVFKYSIIKHFFFYIRTTFYILCKANALQ